MLTGSSAAASPDSIFAQLALNGVQTAQAPNGTHALYVAPGESVTFALGSAPPGIQGALGLSYVLLNSSAFPGGSSAVRIDKKTTVTYVFDSAGTFALNWTAYNKLGAPIPPTGGEYTAAHIVVTGGVPPGGSSVPPSSASSSAANPSGRPSFSSPSDHGLAVSASALAHSSHAASSKAGSSAATSSGAVTPSPSTSTTVVAGISTSSTPSRPVALAVIAIVAFACVSGWFAYSYFGLGALRRG